MTQQLPLLVHAAVTVAMAGLIWFVQVVHYPLFEFAAAGDFPRFAEAHQRRTTWVVAPLMLTELATAIWLLLPASGAPRGLAWTGFGLVLSLWLMTGLVQVPLHRRLSRGFSADVTRLLVATNWLRTGAWSARAVLALWLLTPNTGGSG